MVNQLQQLIPKIKGSPLVVNFERILQPVTDFIRGNPIVSTAIVGAGTTGLVIAGAVVRGARKSIKRKAPKKRIKAKRRKRVSKRIVRRKKRKTHSSPRHIGHKVVTFTTKDGKRVKFKVAKKKHTHRKRRR